MTRNRTPDHFGPRLFRQAPLCRLPARASRSALDVIHITFFAKCDPDHVSAQMHGVSFQGYGLAETTCRRVLPAMSTRKPGMGNDFGGYFRQSAAPGI